MKRFMSTALVAMALLLAGNVSADDSRFTFSDKTVQDRTTGLVWTKDANLGKRNWEDSFKLVNELNQKKYGGFDDWRLPTKKELEELLNYAGGGKNHDLEPFKTLNRTGFANVQEDGYWSSTAGPDYTITKGAFLVDMKSGRVVNVARNNKVFVWPVRVGAPPMEKEVPVEINVNSTVYESIRKDGTVNGKQQLLLIAGIGSNERKSVEALLNSSDSDAVKEREKSLTARGKELYSQGPEALLSEIGYISLITLVNCEERKFAIRGVKFLNWGKRPLIEAVEPPDTVEFTSFPRDKFGKTLEKYGCE